ncbi:flagellar hook-length control protein FliK [Herbaspirillum sp. NPDC087042]|uniref:flagellar hook-length control protein FliK n=1 Tax=Herbaspirillum sp. NPDC087042 TaxID=3364004 RepID=UPI00381B227D
MNPSLPLLNVLTGSQAANASRSSNLADSFSADASFTQMLNNQVSARTADNNAQNAAPASQDSSASAPPPATPAPPAAQAAQSTTSSDKSASTSATSDKQETSAKNDDQDDDTTTQASAELLALVANLQQNAVTPVNNSKGSDADLLAQGKRGNGKGSLEALDAQAAALDAKGKKIDINGLQSSIDANKARLDAGATQTSQDDGQASADLGADGGRGGKPAIDLNSAAKAAPKNDSSAQATSAQLAKVAPEAQASRQDLPLATPTPVLMPAMQQTLAANQPQAVFGAAYTDKIQPNVGSAGWDQAVGNKITWMATGGIQSASLTLNPPDLGPMQVVLSVHNQQADATFITAQPEVKQALEAAMPKLREMMDQAGIQLGQATVNTGMPNQQQGANSQQQARGSSSSGGSGQDEEGDLALAGVAGTTQATTSGLGLVDTFV